MPLYRGTRYAILAAGGIPGPAITLSATSVPEDAVVGAVIGTLAVANGRGTYAFTVTADPDGKFAIGGGSSDELQTDAALDYEAATSHQVTIEADNGVDDPISRTFTIAVVDVVEA